MHTPSPPQHFWKYVFITALIAGTLDMTAACINFWLNTHKSPVIIFQYIASAVFGKTAYKGDIKMMATGIAFHYIIAFLFTLFYYLVAPAIKPISKHIAAAALLYGAFVWAVMNLVVVPMSNAKPAHFTTKSVIIQMSILIGMIALPAAISAAKYYRLRRTF